MTTAGLANKCHIIKPLDPTSHNFLLNIMLH
jgi:hypothetical protein